MVLLESLVGRCSPNSFGASTFECVFLYCRSRSMPVKRKNSHATAPGFLSAIRAAYSDSEPTGKILAAILAHIEQIMDKSPSGNDWRNWNSFLLANNGLKNDLDLSSWASKAESFCNDEIDEIIRDADSSTGARDRFDRIESIAHQSSLSLEPRMESFNERLQQLLEREAEPKEEEKQEPEQPTSTPDDDVIDRLVSSLPDKASELN